MPEFQTEEETIASLLKSAYSQANASPPFKERLLSQLMKEGRAMNVQKPRKLRAMTLVWAPVVAVALALIVFFVITGLPGQSPVIIAPPPPTSPLTTPETPPTQPTPPPTSPSTTPETPPTQPTPPPLTVNTGILRILVTDAPPQRNVTELNVMLSNIQVTTNASTEDDSSWVTVFADKSSFDLIKLRDSSLAGFLGESTLDTGLYYQIRMDVEIIDAVIDNQRVEVGVTLPSGKLKLVSSFEIKENQTTVVTIDFDADQSLVFTGSDKVIFKPVVKLIVAYE